MKILYTITYYFPYISGLTIHVQRMAEALTHKGYIVNVLTSQHQKNLPQRETYNNVEIIRVPYFLKLTKGFIMPRYFLNAFNLVKQNDVIVINLPQAEGFIPALLARFLGKPILCIYHCEVTLPKSFTNKVVENLLHASNLISLWCAQKIITYTQDFAKHSKLLPYFSQKLSFVYPPIPTPKPKLITIKTLQSKVPKKTKYHIGIAARIASEKGIEYLLEAIPYIEKAVGKDFAILIAGPKNPVGEEVYWQKIIPLLNKYKDHIIFLGTLSFEEMGSFYSLLDVLVLPSINSTEAFGMVQVEAMLCGTPVVASNLPGVRIPIKQTGMGELAKPKAARDLASKIIKVITKKDQYIKSKKFIENTFNFQPTIDSYERLFRSIS